MADQVTTDDIRIVRFESGIQETDFAVDGDGNLDRVRTGDFHPNNGGYGRNSVPRWELYVGDHDIEFECQQAKVMRTASELIDDMVTDGQIESNPLRDDEEDN